MGTFPGLILKGVNYLSRFRGSVILTRGMMTLFAREPEVGNGRRGIEIMAVTKEQQDEIGLSKILSDIQMVLAAP